MTLLCTLSLGAAPKNLRIIQTNSAGDNIHLIDPASNKVVDQYCNYPKADAIRYGFGSVWVSDHGKGELWRIDPAKMRGR